MNDLLTAAVQEDVGHFKETILTTPVASQKQNFGNITPSIFNIIS